MGLPDKVAKIKPRNVNEDESNDLQGERKEILSHLASLIHRIE